MSWHLHMIMMPMTSSLNIEMVALRSKHLGCMFQVVCFKQYALSVKQCMSGEDCAK
jgi:hypothetical protein